MDRWMYDVELSVSPFRPTSTKEGKCSMFAQILQTLPRNVFCDEIHLWWHAHIRSNVPTTFHSIFFFHFWLFFIPDLSRVLRVHLRCSMYLFVVLPPLQWLISLFLGLIDYIHYDRFRVHRAWDVVKSLTNTVSIITLDDWVSSTSTQYVASYIAQRSCFHLSTLYLMMLAMIIIIKWIAFRRHRHCERHEQYTARICVWIAGIDDSAQINVWQNRWGFPRFTIHFLISHTYSFHRFHSVHTFVVCHTRGMFSQCHWTSFNESS